MYFSVSFEKQNDCCFDFKGDKYIPQNLCQYEPEVIKGTITIEEKAIGRLEIYKLYNDNTFFEKCDNFSDDCALIAEMICGKKGSVLKRYLPSNSEYENIFILDKISIDSNYRKKGIGFKVIKNLLDMLTYQFDSGCAVFLSASDYESAEEFGFESKEYFEGCKRLKAFYEKAGYTKVKDNVYVYKRDERF